MGEHVDDAAFNTAYYRAHKEAIAKRKATRYAKNPEYQRKAKEARAKQYLKEKEARRKKREAGTPSASDAAAPAKKMRIVTTEGYGVLIGMYSISQAAYRIGIAVPTIRKWESLNVLPFQTIRTKGTTTADGKERSGHRLYTEDQIAVILDVYTKHQAKQKTKWRLTDEFIRDLHAGLNSLDTGVDLKKRRIGEDEDE